MAHVAIGLENDLGLGIEGQDELRIVLSPKPPEHRQFPDLRIGQGVGPRIEAVAAGFDVVGGHGKVLRPQIGQ